MTEPSTLSLAAASYGYDGVPIVRDVSLEVATGEAVFLVGPNGAGKSTTLAGIFGTAEPMGGSTSWRGDEMGASWGPHQRARSGLSLVPEGRRIFPSIGVEAQLRLAHRAARRIRSELDHDLGFVYEIFPRLAERRQQQGGLLSGGEQQMLAIGRALMQAPSILVVDELSMGLAPTVYQDVADRLLGLLRDGLGLLLVEQNARLAMKLCHRGYLMSNGNIVLSGTSHEMAESGEMHDLYLGAQ